MFPHVPNQGGGILTLVEDADMRLLVLMSKGLSTISLNPVQAVSLYLTRSLKLLTSCLLIVRIHSVLN